MQTTGFATGNCHSQQHKVVLAVLREGSVKGSQGDLATIRHMAAELGPWFSHHAQNMDAALALHMRRAGFDPVTGAVLVPEALPAEPITGCGGACGETEKKEVVTARGWRAEALRQRASAAAQRSCRPPWGRRRSRSGSQGYIAGEARMGKILIRPPAITSMASAAKIRPMSRVITLMPVLPSTRAIGWASEKQTMMAAATTTP